MQDDDEAMFDDDEPRVSVLQRMGPGRVIALGLSVGWFLIAAIFLLFGDFGTASNGVRLMALVGAIVPIALIWIAGSAAEARRTARALEQDNADLRNEAEALRQGKPRASAVEDLDRVKIPEPRQTVAFSSRREASATPPAPKPVPKPAPKSAPIETPPENLFNTIPEPDLVEDEDEENLFAAFDDEDDSLGFELPQTPATVSLAPADFIRAINFPHNPEDTEGFRTLKLAFQDPLTAELIQAAQDILTLLSEEGIYMDDLSPDTPAAVHWRRFADGFRGDDIAALGAVRDESCLAITSKRMRADPIFRDAVHHFLRRFDRAVSAFIPGVTDDDIAAFAETRSARAFMLLGHVAGTFVSQREPEELRD